MTEHNNITYPKHYVSGKIELTDFIIDKNLNWCRANIVKYVVRAGIKNPDTELEDIKKAQWYFEKEIERLEAKTFSDWNTFIHK
jgi:hypothetical protein